MIGAPRLGEGAACYLKRGCLIASRGPFVHSFVVADLAQHIGDRLERAVVGARPGHDLAAKPGDLGGMHLGINPQGERLAPRALKPSHHPTLMMTTDTSCGRGRFNPNRRVFAAGRCR